MPLHAPFFVCCLFYAWYTLVAKPHVLEALSLQLQAKARMCVVDIYFTQGQRVAVWALLSCGLLRHRAVSAVYVCIPLA